jgi:hypothetical protein
MRKESNEAEKYEIIRTISMLRIKLNNERKNIRRSEAEIAYPSDTIGFIIGAIIIAPMIIPVLLISSPRLAINAEKDNSSRCLKDMRAWLLRLSLIS